MENLLFQFLSLPHVVVYAICGGVAGALAGAFGLFLGKLFKSSQLTKIATIISIGLAVQVPKFIIPELEKEVAPVIVINKLKEQRLFSVLFRFHPDAEIEMKQKMDTILRKASVEKVRMQAQAVSAELSNRYFSKHLLSASDESTQRLIRHNLDAMRSLEKQPSLCVGYYLGSPNFDRSIMPQTLIARELDLRADVIESSVNNPSLPPQAASLDSIMNIIISEYQRKGYALSNLARIDKVESVTAEEGCRIAMEFMDAIASLDTKQSAYVFKNLLYLGTQR